MTTRVEAKRQLLELLAVTLDRDDDLIGESVDPESKDYERWDAARNELAAEFRRRARRTR